MIHPLVKIITVDGFFKEEDAIRMYHFVGNLKYEENEFGKEVTNFNLVTPDQGAQFSKILNTNITVDEEKSGVFRYPHWFIHFEGFDSMNEWVFAVALQQSTFNVYENKRGPKTALEGYQLNYQNLFEWDLLINYILKPGQGILFRPWLFHSFDNGLIQIFRLREQNDS